jgi:oxygen-independent coproporphyrinogen-3 oxidase
MKETEVIMNDLNQITAKDPATSLNSKSKDETGSVFVSNYPPFSHWSQESVADALKIMDEKPTTDTNLGLYLHIPFCRKRCNFCYFKVYTGKNSQEISTYLGALKNEIELQSRNKAFADQEVEFVYFGGGTPSFISENHLKEVMSTLTSSFNIKNVKEFAFECEPGTLTQKKLGTIKELGVTRLSLGIEHFDDRILELNGRAHRSKEIYRVHPLIKERNFDQLNIDLIAGLIGESWVTWKDTIEKTIDYDPDSITVYQLELPYNAVFSKQIREGEMDLSIPDWDLKREYHAYAIEKFQQAGYEVSSAYTMAKKNTKFVYRDSLWHGSNMLAFGVASFGHVGGIHYQNNGNWDDYIEQLNNKQLPIYRAMVLSESERLTRELILQLKLGRVSVDYFDEKFGINILSEYASAFKDLKQQKMLEYTEKEVTVTEEGLLRVDELLPSFYDEKYRESRYT